MELKRYPYKRNDLLKAWDSADELILAYMKNLDLQEKSILIINDHFGALSVGLEDFNCTVYTDSYVSSTAIKLNSHQRIDPICRLSDFSGFYDYVLIQIPKNMSYFEDLLATLTSHLKPHSQLICGSMLKHLAPASFELLNKYIGPTTTSLAQKKARLVFARFEKKAVTSPFPISVKMEGFQLPFIHHSNLFSREKLDIGTRFFLQQIPQGSFQNILDLGCANGIIGIKAKELNPEAKIFFSDDSAMALESASINYRSYFADEADFCWTNCYEGQEVHNMDLVLCNPPFHQGTTIGDFIAWQMFQDAYKVLSRGGLLRIIGNSHLGYQVKLKKIFGNAKIVDTNNKFIICDAIK